MDKETVKIGDRIFKLCEDVPLAVKEKRRLFWLNNGTEFELRFISDGIGPDKNFLFLYDAGGVMGDSMFTYYRKHDSKFNYLLYFDVTPEKRYAVWNGFAGRFVLTDYYGRKLVNSDFLSSYTTRLAAVQAIQRFEFKNPNSSSCGKLKVVEFDNPDAE